MQGIGLVVLVIGLSMALESQNFISVLLSLAIGGILGGWLKVEDRLNQFGKWVENRWKGESPFATGFVTGTLVYCIGPMAVLGGLDTGLRGDHEVLVHEILTGRVHRDPVFFQLGERSALFDDSCGVI